MYAAETTKDGFVECIACSHCNNYPEDTFRALEAGYGGLLYTFDYFGPDDELSGLITILRKSSSCDTDGAGFVWVAKRWNNDVGHIHEEQQLAHFCKFS